MSQTESDITFSKRLARDALKDPIAMKYILRKLYSNQFRPSYTKSANRPNNAPIASTTASYIARWIKDEYLKTGAPISAARIKEIAKAWSNDNRQFNMNSINCLLSVGTRKGWWNKDGRNRYIPA